MFTTLPCSCTTTGRRTRRRYAATRVYPVSTGTDCAYESHRLRSSDMPSKLRAWLVIREYGFGVGAGVGLGSCRVLGYGGRAKVRVRSS